MILQNKKTGALGILEAATYHGGRSDNIIEVYEMRMGAIRVLAQYKTLEELLQEWEDYKSAEPLIKDEKIRKVVQAWAEVNGIDMCVCTKEIHCILLETERGMFITFENADPIPPEGKYTITELCGEEEE